MPGRCSPGRRASPGRGRPAPARPCLACAGRAKPARAGWNGEPRGGRVPGEAGAGQVGARGSELVAELGAILDHERVVEIALEWLLGRGDIPRPVVLANGVLEDPPADQAVQLLRVRNVIDFAQRLVLAGGLHHELAVPEQAPGKGAVEAHVRDL